MSNSEEIASGDEAAAHPGASNSGPVIGGITPSKTPMYEAIHAGRYQRQAVIRTIEQRTGRYLICYVSGAAASIDRDDTLGFVELLHNVPKGKNVDLMLHTGGGDIDAAEKLITLVRTAVGESELRIVVPDFAKSAGTLIALGADMIVMSDASELGPIDPQVVLKDANGNLIRHSILSYLDAYEAHTATLRKNPGDVAARIMLSKLEPATIALFQAVRRRAQKLAEDQLQHGMFRRAPGNFTQIARDLLDTSRWPSHGQMIGWQDAKQIGLNVDFKNPKDPEWQLYWQLYCQQRLAVGDRQKLFESEYVSFPLDSTTS